MHRDRMRLTSDMGDRRGVALPVALFGLIIVSVIITGVLLSSSTEAALSIAHQDATRGLYVAEAAAGSFVAREPITGPETRSYTPPTRPSSEAAMITIERMLKGTFGDNVPLDSTYLYAVTAMPAKGGRGISTQVQVDRMAMRTFAGDISSALTCDDCSVGGNSTISNGGDGKYCAAEDSVTNAVTYAKDGGFGTKGSATVRGEEHHSDLNADQLFKQVLGAPIRDFAFAADLKFGTMFNETAFSGKVSSVTSNGKGAAPRGPYNWGCPGAMETAHKCASVAGTDTAYAPIVAIDAQGGTVTVNGDHGQGMLIVLNGDLKVNGNFIYRGIIVSEGAVHINGAGKDATKIEGAVIAAGAVEFSDSDPSIVNGGGVIRYNRCAIELAQASFNNKTDRYGAPTVRGRNFAWFEVVR
jgi:hypothetical protein